MIVNYGVAFAFFFRANEPLQYREMPRQPGSHFSEFDYEFSHAV